MGYPARYRTPSPQTGVPSTPRPRVGGNNVHRFPIRRPFARGRFGPPTALPGRPGFGLRPPAPIPMAPGRSPVVLPGLPLGRFAGLLAAGLYAYDLYRSWNDGQSGSLIDPSPANGWAHICGPIAWPGPPYLKSVIRVHGAGILTTPRCGLGLQVAIPNAPYPSARNVVDYYQHGTLPTRGYVMNQWSRSPSNGVAPPLRVHYPTQDIQVSVGTVTDAFGTRLPLANIGPIVPMPPSWGRLFNAPGWPEGPRRGYTHPDFDGGNPYDQSVTDNGTRLHVVTVSPPRDRPPDRNERERKAEAGSRIGRLAISGFRGLQTWASVNGAIDALWNAIPRSYRPSGKRSWWQKYQDVYENFEHIDLAAAARNSVLFAAQQRAYGAFFGAVTSGLTRNAGPNTGWGIYRGLTNMPSNPDPAPWPSVRRWYAGVKEGTRRGPYRPYSVPDFGARPRVYSGRAGPRRRREQTILRSVGRKFWWARRRAAARYSRRG